MMDWITMDAAHDLLVVVDKVCGTHEAVERLSVLSNKRIRVGVGRPHCVPRLAFERLREELKAKGVEAALSGDPGVVFRVAAKSGTVIREGSVLSAAGGMRAVVRRDARVGTDGTVDVIVDWREAREGKVTP